MTSRGVRNNNPGNIRHSVTDWQGEAKAQPDAAFVTFSTMEFGIRAMGKTLLTYQRKYGLKTIAQIIGRWAPPNENATGAYMAAVSRSTGFAIQQALDLSDRATLWRLVAAIIKHENGADASKVSAEQISLGVSLALK